MDWEWYMNYYKSIRLLFTITSKLQRFGIRQGECFQDHQTHRQSCFVWNCFLLFPYEYESDDLREYIDNIQQAIECYIQADTYKDIQGMAAMKLGEIYESQQNAERAAYYYQKYINKIGRSVYSAGMQLLGQKSSPEATKALLYLTKYYSKRNDIKSAFEYGDILLSVSSDQVCLSLRHIRMILCFILQKVVDEVHQILNNS